MSISGEDSTADRRRSRRWRPERLALLLAVIAVPGAPWLLAALVLLLLAPIVRAAGRGDPFRSDATKRLSAAGTALLVGLPGIALLSYWVAESATAGRTFVSPGATPSLTISVAHVLPGLLLLVLAGVFRTGADLREFERHAI